MNTAPLATQSPTVLVIDDDDFSQEVISAMLKTQGIDRVQCVGNGREALHLMAEQPALPDYLICDIFMPDMDGIEFVGQLVSLRYPGSLILMSGGSAEMLGIAKTVAEINGLKVLGALRKPLSMAELAQAMS
jgi:CheY-like chemotaxis protein